MKLDLNSEKMMEYAIDAVFIVIVLVLAASELFDHPQKCIDRCKYNQSAGISSQDQLPVCIKRCRQ